VLTPLFDEDPCLLEAAEDSSIEKLIVQLDLEIFTKVVM